MSKYPFTLKDLPYGYEELSPVISAETLKLHHDKHLNAYVTNLNVALESKPELQGLTLVELLSDEKIVSENPAIRNNGGGIYNHELYFDHFAAKGSKPISAAFEAKIVEAFGSFDNFKAEFKKAGMGQFGSGWAWLVKEGDTLKIMATPNQDTPLVKGVTPILGIDVWEHAYYVDYRNLRPDYLEACFDIINWEVVENNYNA